jgi:hypothetical protein
VVGDDVVGTLQQMDFDYYDERVYDRLVTDNEVAVRGHLIADPATRRA